MHASGETRPVTAAPERFSPDAIEAFRFVDRDLDEATGTVRLRYALDDVVSFEETVELPPAERGADRLDGALDLLFLTAGTSYFKAADPPRVDTGPLAPGPALAALGDLLYGEGLAEFRHEAGRPVASGPRFGSGAAAGGSGAAGGASPASAAVSAPAAGLDAGRSLVPIGGGKDSIVTVEALKRAGSDLTLFSVGDAPPIAGTARVAERPRLIARRTLSPALLELNARGALNGHVPVTAIVSSIALLVALRGGHGAVVMSNERSASEPTLHTADGTPVNHQLSKSLAAEAALRAAIAERVAGDLDYFSLLRPAGELAIARRFATLTGYHPVFTSCNTVFRLDPARRRTNWCGNCPKCRFVFLILAPFMSRDALVAIFGTDLLDDPAQADGFAALTGGREAKPFECVGTVEESLTALRAAAAKPDWREAAVPKALAPLMGDAPPDLAAALRLSGEHFVPPAYEGALHAALGP